MSIQSNNWGHQSNAQRDRGGCSFNQNNNFGNNSSRNLSSNKSQITSEVLQFWGKEGCPSPQTTMHNNYNNNNNWNNRNNGNSDGFHSSNTNNQGSWNDNVNDSGSFCGYRGRGNVWDDRGES